MCDEGLEKINILVVDDRPEKVLALEAALDDLHQNVIRAYSGREALRCVLQHDLAVILLDVNMPDLDGFETAALIRRRHASAHIPIIFITAFSDAMYVERGYALGAVDYILSPPSPEVLRTKVSVFVDLHRKAAQIKRQAERLEQRAEQLNRLAAASLTINSALAADKMLQAVADSAREIIGAHQASILMLPDHSWSHALWVSSLSDKYAAWRHPPCRPRDGQAPWVLSPVGKPIRLTREQMEAEPGWLADRKGRQGLLPLEGLLAAPLTSRHGRSLGLIQLSDRYEGDFCQDDEVLLVQLSQMSSVAIENALFAEEREANKIKDEFLSTVSHELRTPLQAMLGWSKMLISSDNLDTRMRQGLTTIQRNVRMQAKLIEDLLDVSRISSGKLQVDLQPMCLGTVVQAAIEAVRPSAEEKGIELAICPAADGDQLLGDPSRLQQVVWNLLTNAIKFTPKGGRVEISQIREGTSLQVHVKDNGEGISPKFLPLIFDRFKQYDSSSTRSQGGLGIGLTIARHIVDLHGGTLEASSAGKGQGTSFIVTLPASLLQSPAVRDDGDPSALAPWNHAELLGTLVLVVEDEPDAREVIAHTLREAKAEVLTACSAAEGLAILEQHCPDVLISDIAMCGQDGYDFIRTVRNSLPEPTCSVPALALTAYAGSDDRLRALAAGFHMHLAKPVEPAALVSVAAALAARREAGEAPALASGGTPA